MKPGSKHYFHFLWAMTQKEIKTQYKRAALGFLWVIINPVLQVIIIGLIFSFFIKIPNYFLFLFSGLVPWTFFSRSLNGATTSIVTQRSLLQKSKFPKEAIPISIVLSKFLQMLVSLALILIFLIVSGKIVFPNVLLIIPALFWLLSFSVGLSLLSSSLQVRYRDVSFLVQTILILWFYATPIIYDLSLIPARLRSLFLLNPLTSIFELFHISILKSGSIDTQTILLNLLMTVVIIFLGIAVYKSTHKYFVDWL